MTKDTLYAQSQSKISDFIFDENVAAVFDDMIHRSVPGYDAIIHMIGVLAEQYVQPQSRCYDLGCSLGTATLTLRQRMNQPDCQIISVDNSLAMIERCRQNVEKQSSPIPVELICADIQEVEIEKASMAILNFTLQFIEPSDRQALLQRIYDGILPGGILIVSDKIVFDDPEEQQLQDQLHYAFKKLHGYSDMEISQKRTALEKVLVPDTLQTHQNRLQTVGFARNFVWFQCFNFASIIAFKN